MKTFWISLVALVAVICGMAQRGFANLHDTANSADYVIITARSLIEQNSWIGQLAAWRAQQGRTAMVVATDSIWAEFGNGTPSDTVLKDFLFYAYDHWSAPRLRDVFIIGWHDVVPSHIQPDSDYYVDSTEHEVWQPLYYLNDYFYATHPDSTNHLPLLNIGRLPWSPADTSVLWDYYAKIHAYETAASTDWQRRVQMVADYSDPFHNYWQDMADPIAQQIQPGYTIMRDYMDTSAANPFPVSRDQTIADFNSGNYLTFYAGRAGSDVWSNVALLTAATVDSLANGDRLPIIIPSGKDCGWNGDWQLGGMAASFIRNPQGGAVGYLGVSSVEWAIAGTDFRRELALRATGDSVHTMGDIWRLALCSFISWNAPDNNWGAYSPFAMTVRGSMLFGDPGLVLPARPAAVEDKTVSLPMQARLVGNFPNPFNSQTELRFELSQPQNVRLRVMNILGQEVARLADGVQGAGTHVATWNAAACGSGIYFAFFEAGNVKQVRKMMLLK